ncbi:MAG: hypothetical protein ACJ8D9_26720 [Xanthobacteraceae bacterium]
MSTLIVRLSGAGYCVPQSVQMKAGMDEAFSIFSVTLSRRRVISWPPPRSLRQFCRTAAIAGRERIGLDHALPGPTGDHDGGWQAAQANDRTVDEPRLLLRGGFDLCPWNEQ